MGVLVPIARPVSITVIIPTIGRDSLYRTLDALAVQLEPGDEVLVVADDPERGEPINFRKRARDNYAIIVYRIIDERSVCLRGSYKVVVSLVDQHVR